MTKVEPDVLELATILSESSQMITAQGWRRWGAATQAMVLDRLPEYRRAKRRLSPSPSKQEG